MPHRPPGPNGAPLVGNTHQYARDPFRFMSAVGEAYGDVSRFELAGQETFMVTDPSDVERVLVAGEDRFRKPVFGDDAVEELLGEGLLLSEGDFWREQRRRARPAFAPDRVDGMGEMMVGYARDRFDSWDDGGVVDIREEMAKLTVQIIVEAMFGSSLDEATTETVQEALQPLGERFEPSATRFLLPTWLPTEENRAFRRGVETLERVVDDLVERRRPDPEGDDLLAIMVRAADAGDVPDRAVRDELMTMLLAGHDTTALALTYALVLLDANPDALDRYHAEVDALDGDPTVADARDLEFTERALTEAMRLYPPVYALFREARTDVRLGGHRVPAGSLVMLPQWVVHRDERWFDDPEAFRPDRWLDDDRPSYAYFPFGGGPRGCIGKRLSLLEARLILGTLGRRFECRRLDDGPLDLRPSLTMHPADPVEMELVARDG